MGNASKAAPKRTKVFLAVFPGEAQDAAYEQLKARDFYVAKADSTEAAVAKANSYDLTVVIPGWESDPFGNVCAHVAAATGGSVILLKDSRLILLSGYELGFGLVQGLLRQTIVAGVDAGVQRYFEEMMEEEDGSDSGSDGAPDDSTPDAGEGEGEAEQPRLVLVDPS